MAIKGLTEELSSRSNFVPDQLSMNDKKVFLSGKAVVEEILSMMILAQNSVVVIVHCRLLLTDTYFK